MATIVHRRSAPAPGPEAPRGPGGSFDSLTWVGYASLVAAFGFLVFGLRPLTEMGDPRMWDWEQLPFIVVNPLRSAAVLLLPAALEIGVPGARRAVPWLMRGAVLLALEELLRPVIRAGQTAVIDGQTAQGATTFSYADPAWIAIILAAFAVSIIGIAGAWSLSDGLSDAGGRPRRGVLVLLAAAGTALVLVAYAPMLAIDSGQAIDASAAVALASNLAGIALDLVDNVLWLVISARLVVGLAAGCRPRTAWVIGGVAGLIFLALRLASPLLFGWSQPDRMVSTLFLLAGTASWVLLAIALAAGLGRGRTRRRPRPRRVRLFVLNPTG